MLLHARAINHFGIEVRSLDVAVQWYQRVLGFELITPPYWIDIELDDRREFFQDVLGRDMVAMGVAHMATASGVGLEIVQPTRRTPEKRRDSEVEQTTNVMRSHICITEPDIVGLKERVERAGGRVRSDIWQVFENEPVLVAYLEDPDGNLVEALSTSYERLLSNRRGRNVPRRYDSSEGE